MGPVPACALSALLSLALGVMLPVAAQAQQVKTTLTGVGMSRESRDYEGNLYDIKAGLANLSAEQKSKISPALLQRMNQFGLNASEIDFFSFALATGVIKELQWNPEQDDANAALEFMDAQLARTLAFNQALPILTGSPAGITVESYPAFIDRLYGPQRLPTAQWKRVAENTPRDTGSNQLARFRELTPDEISQYDARMVKQAEAVKAQFAKYTPDEKAWVAGFLNEEALNP